MKPLAIAMTSLALYAGAVHAAELQFKASFDCRAASSPTEKLICSSDSLRFADRHLSERYQGLAAVLPAEDKEKLRGEQREWLKGRDQLASGADLEAFIKARANALDGRLTQVLAEGEHAPSLQLAQAICTEIRDHINLGTLQPVGKSVVPPRRSADRKSFEESFGVRIDEMHEVSRPGAPTRRFVEVSNNGGTCISTSLVDYQHIVDKTARYWLSLTHEPFADGQTIGRSQILVEAAGQLVVAEGIFHPDQQSVDGVLWLGPRAQHPLCEFSMTGEIKYEADSHPVCQALANGRAELVAWEDIEGDFETVGAPPEWGSLSGMRQFDLDNDGKPETVGLWTFEHSSGCGGTLERLVQITPEETKATPSRSFSKLSDIEWRTDGTRLFRLAGRGYILGADNKVLSITKGGNIEHVCDVRALRQVKIGGQRSPE